jgi:predicted transcriptional regulator
MGDLQYHLYVLEKEGSVKSVRRGLHKFIYASGMFGAREEKILSVLSQETPREIILHVIDEPDTSQMRLAEEMGLSRAAVAWHMKRLEELGLIVSSRKGKNAAYRPLGDSRQIASFVQSYHPAVWEKWASRFTDILLGMRREGEKEGEEK